MRVLLVSAVEESPGDVGRGGDHLGPQDGIRELVEPPLREGEGTVVVLLADEIPLHVGDDGCIDLESRVDGVLEGEQTPGGEPGVDVIVAGEPHDPPPFPVLGVHEEGQLVLDPLGDDHLVLEELLRGTGLLHDGIGKDIDGQG